MEPVREQIIRGYAEIRTPDPWKAPGYVQELLEALDTERERNAKLIETLRWIEQQEGWQWSTGTEARVREALGLEDDDVCGSDDELFVTMTTGEGVTTYSAGTLADLEETE